MITNLQNLKPGVTFRVFEMPGLTGTLVDINECSAKVQLAARLIDVEIESPDGSSRRFTANKARTVTWSPATVVETIEASAATSPPAQPDATPAEAQASPEENPMKTVTKAKKTPKAKAEPKARKPKATNVTKGGGGTRVRSSAKTEFPPAPGTKAPKEVKAAVDKLIDSLPGFNPPQPVTTKKSRKPKMPVVSMVKEVANVEVPIMLDSVENVRKAVERKLKDHPKQAAKMKPSLLDIAADVLSDGKPRNCDQIIMEVLARGDWKTSGKTPAATLYSGMIREINNPNGKKPSRFERTATKGEFQAVK